jgi:hypothetical protein
MKNGDAFIEVVLLVKGIKLYDSVLKLCLELSNLYQFVPLTKGLEFAYHSCVISALLSNTYIARSISSEIMGKFFILSAIHFINYIKQYRVKNEI